ARWGVTAERLRPGQKVMHPGPMNRGVEIDAAVADAADALIEHQVRSGLVVRMAVLYDLLTHGPAGVQAATLHEIGAAWCCSASKVATTWSFEAPACSTRVRAWTRCWTPASTEA